MRRNFACAATLSLCVCFSASRAQAADDDEARKHFTAAVSLLKDPSKPRYEEAYAEFKKAYAITPSPKILGNIGLCAMKLERDAEALAAYSKYLTDVSDLSAEERAQVERDVSVLQATIANVTVEAKGGASGDNATIIDTRTPTQGETVTNTYGPIAMATSTTIGVRRGHHVMRARFSDGRDVTWESDINGGESHVFELPPSQATTGTPTTSPVVIPPPNNVRDQSPSAARPVPTSVYIAGGTTVALGVATVIVGAVALNTRSSFDEKNDGNNPSEARDLRSRGEGLNFVSDVLLIGTIIGAGVTTYLYLTRPASGSSTRRAQGIISTGFRF